MQTKEIKSVYFVGAGGIGMSALVRYFLTKGYNVGGYDKTPSELTEKLIEELKLSRTRVANLISEQLKSILCENNKLIQIQPELDWPI
jgi:UDP-N-acetylmuramate--alanine ligase